VPVVRFTKPKLRVHFWTSLALACSIGYSFFESWHRRGSIPVGRGVLFGLVAIVTVLSLFVE
jgi:hypothetical protein